MALYGGEFLAGFSLDSALFEEWMVVQREEIHRQAVDALHGLAAYHELRGEYEQAIDYARRQVELEPWQEAAHRQWMRGLALSGKRGEALAQYEACRRALMEELGVEPEEETRALYDSIREGTLSAGAEGRARSVSAEVEPRQRSNLPAPLTPFVGRKEYLAEIGARLGDPGCRLLTLVGPGGGGKTRLALEAAGELLSVEQRDGFSDGVFFVPLAPLRSAEDIVSAVAQSLGFSFYEGREPRWQLLDYLRAKEMLLVLDNWEHLLDGVGIVTEVLRTAPRVKILATSRARLNVQGEHRLQVSGMRYPHGERAEDALEYSAVQLFVQSARRARPAFKLEAGDLMYMGRICRLVQGMPLGILLAEA